MGSEALRLTGSVSSHVGYSRTNNEDNYLLQGRINEDSIPVLEIAPELRPTLGQWHCFAVFDGMGGGARGEIASWLAAVAFQRLTASGPLEQVDVDLLAETAFWDANRRILLREDPDMLGTTGTAIFTDGGRFRVYHLGDSRAYLFRMGGLYQLTEDHTLANVKIQAGIYAANDPQVRIDSHKLTQYIGGDPSMKALKPTASQWMPLLPGDRLLLCSDGLYDMCSDRDIRDCLTLCPEPVTASWKLVELALKNGGKDNVTCLVVGKQHSESSHGDP